MFGRIKQALAGLAALPGQLELIRGSVASYDPQGWRRASNQYAEECIRLKKKLIERQERIEELNRLYNGAIADGLAQADQLAIAHRALTTKRAAVSDRDKRIAELEADLDADLDALTRWRKQSEEACPIEPDSDASILSSRYGICLDKASSLVDGDEWRFTPESLAELKRQGKELT